VCAAIVLYVVVPTVHPTEEWPTTQAAAFFPREVEPPQMPIEAVVWCGGSVQKGKMVGMNKVLRRGEGNGEGSFASAARAKVGVWEVHSGRQQQVEVWW